MTVAHLGFRSASGMTFFFFTALVLAEIGREEKLTVSFSAQVIMKQNLGIWNPQISRIFADENVTVARRTARRVVPTNIPSFPSLLGLVGFDDGYDRSFSFEIFYGRGFDLFQRDDFIKGVFGVEVLVAEAV